MEKLSFSDDDSMSAAAKEDDFDAAVSYLSGREFVCGASYQQQWVLH